MQRNLALLAALLLLCSCATEKPFLTLPAADRQTARFVRCSECQPEFRFLSRGARNARQLGATSGLIGLTIGHLVASSIEKSNAVLKQARSATGEFEKGAIEEQSLSKLPAELRSAPGHGDSRLQIRVLAVGLQEIERDQFAPFARGVASLRSAGGKEIWTAHAHSAGTRPRPLDDFSRQPELYRQDFAEVAADLATQLVEGPLRQINH